MTRANDENVAGRRGDACVLSLRPRELVGVHANVPIARRARCALPRRSTAARRDRDRRRREAARLARARKLLLFFRETPHSTRRPKAQTRQKAKTPKANFKPHKAVVLANARFPRKRRGTCTRASPTARLGIGRKGAPPALFASARVVRAKARFADRRARPRVPGIREIRRVADSQRESWHPTRASRHPSARCSTLSTSSPSAALWGRSGSPRTWTEG